MRKLLVPCDGSDSALRALAHAVAEAKADPMPAQVELLHVADPDAVAADVDQQAVNDPLAADALRPQPPALAMQAMQAAAAVLDQAGIRHALHWRTGEPGAQIAAHACETACDEIIMGTRGRRALANLLLGSVAAKVVQLAHVPVTLVR